MKAPMFQPLTEAEVAAGQGGHQQRDADEWQPIIPPPETVPPTFRHGQLGEASEKFPYNNADGKLEGYQCRFNFVGEDGKPDKTFRPRRYGTLNGKTGWHWKGWGAERPLYRLPVILANPDKPILVVEGEGKADAAQAIFPDYVCTAPMNGAKSPHLTNYSPCEGRSVRVMGDNDDAGHTFADAVARHTQGAGAASVAIVEVPAGFPLKWDFANEPPEGWDVPRLRRLLEAAPPWEPEGDSDGGGETEGKSTVPSPFRITDNAVQCWHEDKDGEGEWQFVCSHVEVAAETRNAVGEDWGRLLVLPDRDGTMHEWPMPMAMLAGNGEEYRRRLLGMGLEIAPGRRARERLHQYISVCRPAERVRCVARIGWYGRAFVLPDETLGEIQGERVLLQTVGAFDHAFRAQGTLDSWHKNVARFAVGNSRLLLSIAAAFAAPLLDVADAESGGFHLRGPSSVGKTTALCVAGSVWGGGGVKGYVRQWRATDNGLEAVAQAHCDALLCLDELSQIDARAAGAAAYMLANGAGKSRAGRGGEGRATAEWRVLFLSSGEIGIAEKVAEDGRGRKVAAGQQVRVLDLPAEAGAGLGLFENLHGFPSADAFARHLKQAAGEHYGTAALSFLAAVTARLDHVQEAVAAFKGEFIAEHCPTGADGQVSRAAIRFALVAAGGELAAALGIVPWERDEAGRAVATCFRAWIEARGGIEAAEVAAGIAQVRRFIEQHGDSRFTPWNTADKDGDRPTINRAGFRRPDGEGGVEYYVLPEVWRTEVCAGFDAGTLARSLAEHGLLIRDNGDGKPQSRHRLPGSCGPVRCYRLAASILGGDTDA